MAAPAAVLQILVTANSAQAVAGLQSVDAQAKRTAATTNTATSRMSRGFSTMASVAKTALVGGLAFGLYKGVKAGIDFEKQMDSVASVANANAREMKELSRQALKLGESTTFSASEVATAQGELAKGGLKVKQILGGALPAALDLAAAGELELGEAAATTVNAMKLFELRARSASKVADMLATAANTTTADVSDFAMALRQGGSAAKAAGLDMNETITILEALAEAGIKNSDAGTSMKTALLQLVAPTEKQAALTKQLGLDLLDQNGNLKDAAGLSAELRDALGGMSNSQRAANLKVLAGTDGFRTLNALYEAGPAKLNKLSRANERQGTAQEIAKEKMDNTAGSLEELSGAFESLSIRMYESSQTPFRGFIEAATEKLREFTKIVTSKKLTSDEKISQVMDLITETIAEAIPKIAEAGFKLGVALTKGIARAFIEGNVLTKLFVGIGVVKLFGGIGALRNAGATIASKIASGLAGSSILGKLGRGASSFMTPGYSPTRPLFVSVVNGGLPGGGPGGPVGGGKGGGGWKPPTWITTPLKSLALIAAPIAVAETIRSIRGDWLEKPMREWTEGMKEGIKAMRDLNRGAAGRIRAGISGTDPTLKDFGRLQDAVLRLSTVTGQMGRGLKITFNAFKVASQGPKFFADSLLGGIDSVKRWANAVKRNNDDVGRSLSGVGRAFKGLAGDTDKNLKHSREDVGRFQGVVDNAKGKIGGDLKDVGKDVGVFADRTDRHTDRAGDAFSRTTGRSGKMAKGIGRNVTSLVNGVGTGLSTLQENLKNALDKFKVKYTGYSIKKVGNVVGDVVERQQGGLIPGIRAGALVPGQGSGDKVPLHIDGRLAAMVEPHEYVSVANRTATGRLMAINRDIPRKQDGGVVPHLAKGGGLMAPFDVQGSKPGFVPFMNFLNNMYGPLYVMSGYRPGSITTSGNISNHASGHAVDISTSESGVDQATGPSSLGGPGAARMDDLHSYMARNIKLPGDFLWRTYTGGNHYNHIHRGITSAEADDPRKMIAYLSGLPGGGAIAESLKRLILKGPKGPLREMGQGALDKAWKAANDFLSRQGPGYSAGKYLKGKGDIFTASWYGPTPATVGAAGVSLPGTMSFAELSDPPGSLNFSALGGLPYHAKIGVRYKDKAIGVEKLDVGAGGPGLGGHVRAIDLWEDAAKQLPGFMSAGIANVEVLRKHGGLVPRLAKGGLVEDLKKVLDVTRKSENDKRRKRVMKDYLKNLKGIGLNDNLSKALKALDEQQAMYGEYAGYAESLAEDGIDRFKGKTQAEWLQQQLNTLFRLRNKLVRAEKVIHRRQREIAKLLTYAEKQQKAIKKAVRLADREKDDLQKQIDREKKEKKPNRELIKHLEKRVGSIDERQKMRNAGLAALKDKIIPAVKAKKTGLAELYTTHRDRLAEVQGPGMPLEHLKSAPYGQLGGEILAVQQQIRGIGGDSTARDSDRLEIIEDLLRQSQQRLAVSQSQYRIFSATPVLGAFAKGGTAMATGSYLVGERGPEVVHLRTGDTVSPNASSFSPSVNVAVTLYEDRDKALVDVNGKEFVAAVKRVNRGQARSGGRVLPGRAGS